jgi:hypothetical protein
VESHIGRENFEAASGGGVELNLVAITERATGKTTYHAVDDRSYDAMLATGGSDLDMQYDWKYLGPVHVSHRDIHYTGTAEDAAKIMTAQDDGMIVVHGPGSDWNVFDKRYDYPRR